MKQEYLLKKAEYYLARNNLKRCIESCINVLTYEPITKEILMNLETIISNLFHSYKNITEISDLELNYLEDFFEMVKGINNKNNFH